MKHHKKSFEAKFARGYDEMLAHEKRKSFLFWVRFWMILLVVIMGLSAITFMI